MVQFAAAGTETDSEGSPNSEVARDKFAGDHAAHWGDEWQAEPGLITQGFKWAGGRPPAQASTGSTGSFATAFAHTLGASSGPNHEIAELDTSHREGDRVPSCVPQLTDEEERHAAMLASTDGSA